MRKLIWPVLFLFLLTVQGSATVFFSGWLAFDLPLLALYSYAVLRGNKYGLPMGFLAGFLQDAMTTGIFGFHMLTRALLGYLVGLTQGKIVKEKQFYHLAAAGLCSLLIRFCYVWLELLHTGWEGSALPLFMWNTAGYCLGNMLLVLPMHFIIRKIYDWIREEDISY